MTLSFAEEIRLRFRRHPGELLSSARCTTRTPAFMCLEGTWAGIYLTRAGLRSSPTKAQSSLSVRTARSRVAHVVDSGRVACSRRRSVRETQSLCRKSPSLAGMCGEISSPWHKSLRQEHWRRLLHFDKHVSRVDTKPGFSQRRR